MTIRALLTAPLLAAAAQTFAAAGALPKNIQQQLPPGYEVRSTAQGQLDDDQFDDFLVVIRRKNEEAQARKAQAPARPLLIFTRSPDGSYQLARRNDHVVLKSDEGGQCDPFEDGDEGLVIKDHYFTVQNSVACGQHWSWYITFKYAPKLHDWVFHKAISESWVMNPSQDPNTDALIPGGSSVKSGKNKPVLLFEKYRNEDMH